MKANKLMIGDWVYDKMLKGYGKIEVLTPFAIQCDIHTDTHNMDFFEPILLTEEILKANEFRESIEEGSYYFPEQYDELNSRGYALDSDSEGNWSITDHTLMTFRHVHELQRVLRCCGLNELADNFKVD